MNEHLEVLQKLFQCTRCGWCCAHGGDMYLTPSEVNVIGFYLNTYPRCFVKGVADNNRLRDRPYYLKQQQPCAFYDVVTKECVVQEVKPECCKRFPFLLIPDYPNIVYVLSMCEGTRNALSDYFGTKRAELVNSARDEVCGAFQSDRNGKDD